MVLLYWQRIQQKYKAVPYAECVWLLIVIVDCVTGVLVCGHQMKDIYTAFPKTPFLNHPIIIIVIIIIL